MKTRPHIMRMLFRPSGYPYSEWMWVCSGDGIMEGGCTPALAYSSWALWHTIRTAVGVAE